MSIEREKANRKARATRKKNLAAKEAAEKKHQNALARARKAEMELRAYKEGFKDGVESQK